MSDVIFCHSSTTITFHAFFQPLALAGLCYISYFVVLGEDKRGIAKSSPDGDVVNCAALFCVLTSRTSHVQTTKHAKSELGLLVKSDAVQPYPAPESS